MHESASLHQWRIIKYKTLKRAKREEYNDVRVVLDESKRNLTVFCGAEEVEHIYCNMEVARYPSLKLKGNHLYVLFNAPCQGFRLTLHAEDKSQFLSIMQKVCFISVTPEKNHLNRSYTNTDRWSTELGKRGISSSQPVSYSHQAASYTHTSRLKSPPKKSAMRNLANIRTGAHEHSYVTPQKISPMTFHSQPARTPNSRPLSSASSVSSSISSAFSSLNDESPFLGFSQNSGGSYTSPHSSDNRKSPFSNSQNSDHQNTPFFNSQSSDNFQSFYRNHFSPERASSPRSSKPVTQSTPVKMTDAKSIQVDSVLLDQLAEDTQFVNAFLLRMMKSSKFGDLVKTMRENLRNLPAETVEDFRKKTEPVATLRAGNSETVSGPPPVIQINSDLEQDLFA